MALLAALGVIAADSVDPTVHTGSGIQGAQLWTFTLGFILPPLLTALILSHKAAPWIKAVLNLLLALVLALVCELLIGPGDFVWQQFWFGFLLAIVSSVVGWFGIWHPTGIDNALKNIASYHRNKNPNAPSNRTEHGYAVTSTVGLGLALLVVGLIVWLVLSPIIGIILVLVGVVLLILGLFSGRRV